ncbi:Protein HID1 (HID1 domain-containing protein) (Protein hid-1 homolog) [Durusdinium trenchii]|uniref:Protein HID1 (HID1 domain-containing protein) (Protein hid-1 homolog) n=1 Tax=Durusdinium trenchii TaxID=1381693 RepID=A0ABP0H9H0_9DINO
MGNSDSKVEFRGFVEALLDEGIPEDSELWDAFFAVATTEDDVFECINPDHVRTLLSKTPERLRTVFHKAVERLEAAVSCDGKLAASTELAAMNASRLLTRMMPFVLEEPDNEFANSMFWDPKTYREQKCLAEHLVHLIGRLLFLPGLTLPAQVPKPEVLLKQQIEAQSANTQPKQDVKTPPAPRRRASTDHNTDQSAESLADAEVNLLDAVREELVWSPGVGTTSKNAGLAFRGLNRNRYELLKLLLVCQSEIIFADPETVRPEANPWIRVTSLFDLDSGMPFARELFCSLLNQVCNYDPVGWGVPYASAVVPGYEDDRFSDMCLHNLLIMLEVNSWTNVYRRLLTDISGEENFTFVFKAIARLLLDVPNAQRTYLPGSTRPPGSYQELLVLLWKLLDCNKEFLQHVMLRSDLNDVVRPVCYFLWTSRKDLPKLGLCHICTFVLLLLSGERNFGVALNRSYPDTLPLDGAPKMSDTNHGDLLVVVLNKLIFDGNKKLETLYSCFLTVLSNISPYIKSFAKVSSVRLVSMFQKFSTRTYLFASESHHTYLSFLLDVFNNVIQYQYEGNARLLYALCSEHAAIKAVANLQFEEADGSDPPGSSVFTPSKDWFLTWKDNLPTSTLTRMLEILVPQIEALCDAKGASANEAAVVAFLKDSTMVGLLPVPHPIVIRRYQPNQYTTMWFTTYTWGVIFLRNQSMALWDGNKIKLFAIKVINSEP